MSGIVGGAGSKSGVIGQTELDYEEGEWTPASSSINLIPSSDANYTRIGNRVTVSAYITTNQASSGDFIITGLPFTNTGASQASGSIYLRATASHLDGYASIVCAAGTQFYVRRGGRTDSGDNVLSYMDAGSNFWFSLTYEIGA
jgi:hypothetical protein